MRTNYAILNIFIYEKLSKSKQIIVAFLAINDTSFMGKLENMGIRDVCISFVTSYLQDRYQVVLVNGCIIQPVMRSIDVPRLSFTSTSVFTM